jgi:predicted nucleic acid-binding protein
VKKRVYLDNCCFNRPYDNQSHLKIELETKAKLKIQESIVSKNLELAISYILEFENDDNPFQERRIAIEEFFIYALINIDESEEVLSIAETAMRKGLKIKDSLHVACAIVGKCDYLITADIRFLKHKDNRIKILNPMEFLIEMEGF